MSQDAEADRRRRNFHGRRHGKALRPTQRRHLEELLPRLSVAGVDPAGNPQRAPVDPAAIFPGKREVWFEIGTGGGEHIAQQAARNPDVGLIGCEPFVNGVATLLGRIAREGLENIRVHPGDARDLIELLPEGSLARVFLLYPDPWPKARHHKRRFMNPENLEELARAMAPGAHLRLATDIPDYVEHALEAVRAVPGFRSDATASTWHVPWRGWVSTRYEVKALREGRRPHYLIFERR